MAGKALSKKTTKHLKAAHALLSKVLAKSDPDDLAEPVQPRDLLGGPQGDEDENYDPYASGAPGALDGTGSRQSQPSHVRIIAEPAVQRRVTGDLEVR